MKTNYISLMMAITLFVTFAAIVPTSAFAMQSKYETLKGVLTSELTLKANNGEIYTITGTHQRLPLYVGHKVKVVGRVEQNSSGMNNGGQINIGHLWEIS